MVMMTSKKLSFLAIVFALLMFLFNGTIYPVAYAITEKKPISLLDNPMKRLEFVESFKQHRCSIDVLY